MKCWSDSRPTPEAAHRRSSARSSRASRRRLPRSGPSVPGNVDAAIRCALEKLPADRFKSVLEFATALSDGHFRYREAVVGVGVAPAGRWNRLTVALRGTRRREHARLRLGPPPSGASHPPRAREHRGLSVQFRCGERVRDLSGRLTDRGHGEVDESGSSSAEPTRSSSVRSPARRVLSTRRSHRMANG